MMSDPAGRWTQWPPSESERDTGGGGLLAEGLEANVNEQTTCLGCLTSWGRKGEGGEEAVRKEVKERERKREGEES